MHVNPLKIHVFLELVYRLRIQDSVLISRYLTYSPHQTRSGKVAAEKEGGSGPSLAPQPLVEGQQIGSYTPRFQLGAAVILAFRGLKFARLTPEFTPELLSHSDHLICSAFLKKKSGGISSAPPLTCDKI